MRVQVLLAAVLSLPAVLPAATFGTVVSPAGGAAYSDIVLDEGRSRLYLVNSTSNRVEIYNLKTKAFLAAIATDQQPVSAAISRDGNSLFISAYTESILDVIDLTANKVSNRISLPANPEGLAVGADGRVLISAVPAVTNTTTNTLMIYDPKAALGSNLISVPVLPTASTPPVLPTPSGRIFTASRSRLLATPDGRWIIGVNGTAAGKTVFVYEPASGSMLRSRSVLNVSTTLSVAADGSKFMAGSTLFDAVTLQVLAQENTANAPFSFTATPGAAAPNFNTQANEGGSAFAPDGSKLYAAFNVAPVGATRPQISQLLVNDPDNLLIELGIEMPENLAGKMVIDAAGSNIYAISDSGFTILPVSTITQLPLASAHSQAVLLTSDVCGVFKGTSATDTIDNLGKGKFTVTATALAAAGGGPGPGGPTVAVPAPTATVSNAGATPVVTFRYNSAAAASPGTVGPTDFTVASPESINIPSLVHVFQNNRDSVSSGTIVPIPLNAVASEGLADLLLDKARNRVLITNSGMNHIEVFDIKTKTLLAPIKVGQLPHGMALDLDGNTLYVANSGGESISIVDLTKGVQTGRVLFPAVPINVLVPIAIPLAIAESVRGPQFIMSDGSFWKVDSNQAIPRSLNAAVFNGARIIAGGTPALYAMASTPGGEFIFLLTGAGNGTGYLYDSTIDDFTVGKTLFSTGFVGYTAPISAGPGGQYYTVGGTVLNSSLTPVQGGTLSGLSTSGRLVPAVTAVSATQIATFTVPLRTNPTAALPDAGQIELSNPLTGSSAGNSPTLEGAPAAVTGATRVAAFPRTMAVDAANATAYVVTTTGLSVVSLAAPASTSAVKPAVNVNGIVSLGNFEPPIAPGGLFTIFGKNLGSSQTAQAPLPTSLGGICLTLNNTPVPMELTSPTQINAQVPVTLAPGKYPLVIRSIDNQAISATSQVTISKYAPAILIDGNGQGAILHADGSYANQDRPAKRDETLTIYATGLGVTHGGTVITGAAAPASPLAETDAVQVFFGNPAYKQAQMIVKSSNLLPGMVGVDQITVTVPGFHQKGAALPVTLKIGGVSSATTGPGVPYVSVN